MVWTKGERTAPKAGPEKGKYKILDDHKFETAKSQVVELRDIPGNQNEIRRKINRSTLAPWVVN